MSDCVDMDMPNARLEPCQDADCASDSCRLGGLTVIRYNNSFDTNFTLSPVGHIL